MPSGSTATGCAFGAENVEDTAEAFRRKGIHFGDYDVPEMGLEAFDGVATQGAAKAA